MIDQVKDNFAVFAAGAGVGIFAWIFAKVAGGALWQLAKKLGYKIWELAKKAVSKVKFW